LSALLVRELVERSAGSILAIDADPNSCLADALGVKGVDTIVGICDEISKNMEKIPAGMTKNRYIEMRVQDAIIELNDLDILVMGRPEGPGCYCYINSLLRTIMDRVTRSYDFVVMDNAAGMEHISRRTAGSIDRLLLVSDYSIQGLRATKKIYELAKSLGIKIGSAWLVVNKVSGSMEAIKSEVEGVGLALAGTIPYEDRVAESGVSGRSVFELVSDNIKDSVSKIVDKLLCHPEPR